MSFEATKNLSGARMLVDAVRMNLESISAYTSPSFGCIGGGKGGIPSDRVSRMLIRKEKLTNCLMSALDACLCLEQASLAELATVDNLELRALIIDRFIHDMPWSDIAEKHGTTSDAVKKRFERGLRSYEDQGVIVHYTPDCERALQWLKRTMNKASVSDLRELKKTSVDRNSEDFHQMPKVV